MRIAFIITALANQGSISVFKELINQLTVQGIELDLFYFDEKIENNFDCKKYRISFSTPLTDYNYDVVHSTGIRPDLYVWLNKKKFQKKTRFITTIHSFIRKDFNNEYNWVVSIVASNLWYRIISAHDRVAVLTNDAKLYYSKLLSSPIRVVNNGRTCIPNNHITLEDEILLRGIGLRYKVLGTHAKISRIKGLDQVIESLVKLTNYAFVAIGEGKDLDELKAQAVRLGVNDRCFFLGFRTNITPFFKFYDIYVMPSRSEGLPMALIEAVANKVACLCSDISTFKEIFSDYEVVKFELANVDNFIEKVIKLEDKQLKEKVISNAFEKYLSSYTAEVMANNYLNLYREMRATKE